MSNRGRHKNNEQERKNILLRKYGARNLEKWKHLTIDEIEWLIKETIRQQMSRSFIINSNLCDLSIYEKDSGACKRVGGINWDETNIGFYESAKILHKLIIK